MSWEDVRLWTPIALGLVTFAWTIHLYRSQARKAEQDKLAERMSRAEHALIDGRERMAAIEHRLQHVPDYDQAHRMEISLVKMQGEMSVLNEQLKPIASISERLQEFLLEQASHHRSTPK